MRYISYVFFKFSAIFFFINLVTLSVAQSPKSITMDVSEHPSLTFWYENEVKASGSRSYCPQALLCLF